jgi:hypothetical protein
MQKLLFFSLFLLLFSCKKDSPSNNQLSAQMLSKGAWPIIAGNYWIYTDSVFTIDGTFKSVTLDTLRTSDSATYQGHVYYGTFNDLPNVYYRQVNDSTNEVYNDFVKNAEIAFRQVNKNNTLIFTSESDKTVWVEGSYHNYHEVGKLTGYTELKNIDGYDCIRNEFVDTYNTQLSFHSLTYVKNGVGPVQLLQYQMKEAPGSVYLYRKRDLVSYKLN